MQMDEGLDTGPVYSRHSIPIEPSDDAGTLTARLAQLGAEVIASDLQSVLDGQLKPIDQDATLVTWAPPLRHEDQVLDFSLPAKRILGKVRGLSPKPGAYTTHRGKRLKLVEVLPSAELVNGPPGTVKLSKRSIWVSTGEGTLELLRLQLEGKAVQQAPDLINGRAIADGDRLG
jgi:methionyl-tRNA formyltransferase